MRIWLAFIYFFTVPAGPLLAQFSEFKGGVPHLPAEKNHSVEFPNISSPLMGEGRGGGDPVVAFPPSSPSPTRGEGTGEILELGTSLSAAQNVSHAIPLVQKPSLATLPAAVLRSLSAAAGVSSSGSRHTSYPAPPTETKTLEFAAPAVDIFDSKPKPTATDVDPFILQGWETAVPKHARFVGLERFPSLYKEFTEELNAKFRSTYQSNKEKFLRDVEQNIFHKPVPEIGEFETKLIEGQAAIRFVPENLKVSPLVVLAVNVPLQVNQNATPIDIQASKHLNKYRARLLIDRKIEFLSLIKHGTWGPPHRSILTLNLSRSNIVESHFAPALVSPGIRWLNDLKAGRRWLEHWSKGTLETYKPGDLARGLFFSGFEFALAYLLTGHAASSLFIGAVSFFYSFICSTFADSYIAFVQRGDNKTLESLKRLFIHAILLSYPVVFFNMGGNWHTLFHAEIWKKIFSFTVAWNIWLVGLGDRYLSVASNVVPKIHQKNVLKPWWFSLRVKMPSQNLLADLTGKKRLRDSTIKGVTLTREVLAQPRFILKTLGLTLDAKLMTLSWSVHHLGWFHSWLPPITLLMLFCGIAFEIYNCRAVTRIAQQNPRVREDLERMKRHSRLLPAPIFNWLFKEDPTSRGGSTAEIRPS